MGPAGAGKSTTAAAFGMQGYALLTEDVLALTPTACGFDVRPGYPQVRLWPDSVRLLYGGAKVLPRLTPTWDKRALAFAQPGLRFRTRPLRLKAVYVLSEAVDPRTAVVSLKGADSVLALLANTYVGYLLDAQQRRDEFAVLTRLAACVPVRRAALAHGATPDDVCAHLLHDLETLERCTA
jgi:hypothetical protein